MKSRAMKFDQCMAVMAIIVGIVCLFESARLLPLRNSLLSGDHALPGLAGAAMIMLGLILLFPTKRQSISVGLPEKSIMIRLTAILGILTVYSISLKYLGYVVPTEVFGIPLFRLFGGYTWVRCVVISTICTAGLYVVFVFGLGMSFPRGLF